MDDESRNIPKGELPIVETGLFLNKEDMSNLKIASTKPLDEVEERDVCFKCHKSRMYFCYVCYTLMDSVKDVVPKVRLPLSVDIIKHAREVDGKCTSSHAAIIAPDDVRVFIYPDIQSYEENEALLVFPRKDAVAIEDIVSRHECKSFDEFPYRRIVFIDSTWRQTKLILNDPKVKRLPAVCLRDHLSLFWRHQKEKPLTFLSTIEAIYYLFVDLHELLNGNYNGQYDNLLFFFKHTLSRIRRLYTTRKLLRDDMDNLKE